MGECLGCGGTLYDGHHGQSNNSKNYQRTNSGRALGQVDGHFLACSLCEGLETALRAGEAPAFFCCVL